MNDTNHVEIQGRISDAGTARQFERTAKRTICIRSACEYNKKDYETWVDVALWGELSSIPWLAAGVLVRVEGRLANESWKTQSGETKSKMVVVAASIVRIMEYAPQPQTYGQYQQRYQQQAHQYQNGQWVPPQANSNLQPPAGVIPSPGVQGGGAASSSPQAGDAKPDLPF